MTEQKRCPECGAVLEGSAEGEGLCAACLIRLQLAETASETSTRSETTVSPWAHEPPTVVPDRIGRYRPQRVISVGGMGVVYAALQDEPKREVAVKVMRQTLVSKAALRRFEFEAEVLARLSHPHIARVFEAGTHSDEDDAPVEEGGGTPYFVMEYVSDPSRITSYARDENLTDRQRLELFLQVCDGVQHGHQKGVIHRDLKPSNILVDCLGQVKIIDFGVARTTDSDVTVATRLTEVGHLIGTLQYMSPEQCEADPHNLDIRSDVYALGVVLYELLCDQLPYDVRQAPVMEATHIVREQSPTRPSTLKATLEGDLETIVLKALEKDRADRYQSVADLADDIRRFLRNEVILARPVTPLRKLGKWIRRNPRLGVAASAAAIVVAGSLGYVLLWSYPQLKNAYAEIVRLSDVTRVSTLEEQALALWPAHPDKLPEMSAWIDEAELLLTRLDDHRRRLKDLRRNARSIRPASDSREATGQASWLFADVQTQWQHDTLADLISRAEAIGDPHVGALRSMKERMAFASSIERRSIDEHREAWDRAIASIADREACPPYDGLRLAPQVGLVPVGRDLNSGLWEFAQLQTGEVPVRGEDGELVLTDATGLVFVLIPAGEFRMGAMLPSSEHPLGSPNVDPRRAPMEEPVHEVALGPFLISKYEMTQGQWLRFTKNNPSWNPSSLPEELDKTRLFPVNNVSWESCARVLSRLGLRLPSEAEWEYAARAGTTTIWWTGDDSESLLPSGYGSVGRHRPNPFGLHDVVSNVGEWCQDDFHSYEDAPTDGSAYEHQESVSKMGRDGRSAYRLMFRPSHRDRRIGVRPAASLRR